MYQYVYCITKAIQKPYQGIFGFENADIHFLKYREIAAVVSKVSTVKIPVLPENVLCHAVVVETVQKEQTVLPLRFSSILKDDTRVFEFLKNHYEVFISDLECLQDKLEMGLRIVIRNKNQQNTESIQSNTGLYGVKRDQKHETRSFSFKKGDTGMAYMEQQRAHYISQDEISLCIQEIVDTCHAQFEGTYTEYRRDVHPSFSHGVSLNYLVYKDCLPEFKIRFHDLMTSLDEFWFLCSGPWPPYHFVSFGNRKSEELC